MKQNEIPGRIEIIPITGIVELRPGDDLVAELARCAPWLEDHDILIVTSKIISKIEGRLVDVSGSDEQQREALRDKAIADETVRIVARRGPLRIVETRHGLVMAAAGVDASNVSKDEIALLPLDPDASARRLANGLTITLGKQIAVVVSDTMGRPWRNGVSDVAIGAAGITSVLDERGSLDKHGNVLAMTVVAVADELAAAGDLVKGKLTDIPIAVVRGLSHTDDGRGAAPLIRGADGDLFRLGTAEAIALGQAQSTVAEHIDLTALHADVLATLGEMPLDPADGTGQAAVREGFYGLLAARADATRRACAPGHITASTLVLDSEGKRVLLTLHPRVGAWLQLGGHVEDDDPTLMAAAAREALEESGIEGIRIDPKPVDLDIHPITCSLGLPTRHFDIRFIGHAPPGAAPVISTESDDLRWFDIDQLPDDIAPELPQLICRAVRHVRTNR
jgi:coenzyme F420-0:L-glutamate ligase